LLGLSQSGSEPRAASKRVGTFAGLDLDEFTCQLEALGLGEPGNDGKRLCEFYFGVPLYAAVALLLVGLAIADQPGTVTIASARLGQANATIRYQQTSKSSDPSGTTACRRLTC
jgi:hypothetical protein